MPRWPWLSLPCVIVAVGVLAAACGSNPDTTPAASPPSSSGQAAGQSQSQTPSDDRRPSEVRIDLPGVRAAGVVFSILKVAVDRYIAGSGPTSLRLRVIGSYDGVRTGGYDQPEFGWPAIMFMSLEEGRDDGVYGQYFGPNSRLIDSGGAVAFDNATTTRVPFETGASLAVVEQRLSQLATQ